MKRTKKFLAAFLSVMMLLSSASVTSFAYTLTGGSTFPFINYTMTDDFSTDATIPKSAYQGWYYSDSSNNTASYAEIADDMLHIHNDKTDTTNNGFLYYKMGKNYTADNKDYPLDKGFVEFGFKFKIEGNVLTGSAASGRFVQYGNKRLFAIVGSKLYSGSTSATCLTDSLTAGDWYSFKIGMNMEKGRTEYFYFNDQLMENVVFTDFDALYTAPTSATYFEIRPQFSGNNSDHADVYIDDVFLKQYTAEFVSASVTDGEKGVNTAAPVVLEFGDILTKASADSITITKNGEVLSGTTATIVGKKVSIAHAKFDEVTTYSINIPASIVSEKGLSISAGKTITFTTGRDSLRYATDFDSYSSTERASVGASMTAATVKTGMGWQYIVNGNHAISNTTTEKQDGARWGKASGAGLILDSKHNFAIVENGRLSIQSDTYKPSSISDYDNRFLRLLPPTAPQTGVVKFGFDYESTITSALGTSGYVQNLIKLGSLAQIGYHNKKLAYWDLVNGSWNTTYLNVEGSDTLLENVKHRFDFVLDLDNNVATVIVDGKIHENLPLNPNGKLNEVQINTKTLKNNAGTAFTNYIRMDNVELEIFDTPAVVNQTIKNASVTDGFTLEFSALMDRVIGITVADATGAIVGYTGALEANGFRYTIVPQTTLDHSKKYTVTVPAQVTADGIVMASQVVTVTTEADENTLYLSDYTISGNITAGATVSVKAVFGNGSGITQYPWLGIALYDAGDKLLEVGAESLEFVSGPDLKDITATLVVPQDVEPGAYIKIFAWENNNTLEPLTECVIFPEVQ